MAAAAGGGGGATPYDRQLQSLRDILASQDGLVLPDISTTKKEDFFQTDFRQMLDIYTNLKQRLAAAGISTDQIDRELNQKIQQIGTIFQGGYTEPAKLYARVENYRAYENAIRKMLSILPTKIDSLKSQQKVYQNVSKNLHKYPVTQKIMSSAPTWRGWGVDNILEKIVNMFKKQYPDARFRELKQSKSRGVAPVVIERTSPPGISILIKDFLSKRPVYKSNRTSTWISEHIDEIDWTKVNNNLSQFQEKLILLENNFISKQRIYNSSMRPYKINTMRESNSKIQRNTRPRQPNMKPKSGSTEWSFENALAKLAPTNVGAAAAGGGGAAETVRTPPPPSSPPPAYMRPKLPSTSRVSNRVFQRQTTNGAATAGGGGGAAAQQGGRKTRKNRNSSRRTRRY
jgi:hypothetical protein